jgi:predicted nucleic acid-binding protein
MIVVDCSILAYLLISGEKTVLARHLYRKDPEWLMPPIWQHEFLDLLARYVQSGGGSVEDAEAIWRESLHLLAGRKRMVRREQALHLACQHAISVYDAMYLVLAFDLGLLLISEDPELQRLFPDVVHSMADFCRT